MAADEIEGPVRREIGWFAQHLITLALTAAISVIGSTTTMYFGYVRGMQEQNESLQADLREQAIDHAGELANLRVEMARLRLQLAGKYNESPEFTLTRILDDMPVPAWCMEYRPATDSFVGYHFNPRYGIKYGIAPDLYKGKTHFDVWPERFAQAFDNGDRRVFETKDGEVLWEPHDPASPDSVRAFLKWYHRSGSGIDMVCGAEVHVDDD